MTFTEQLRKLSQNILEKISQTLMVLGISANVVTLFGFLGSLVVAALVATGNFLASGIVLACVSPLDAIDGTLARLKGNTTNFGAFFDSITDRYSELVIFLGFTIFYLKQWDVLGVVLSFIASAGSVLVSYARARAEGINIELKEGILTRVERYLVLMLGLLFQIPKVALWIIAILANLTAIQRVWIVWKKTKD